MKLNIAGQLFDLEEDETGQYSVIIYNENEADFIDAAADLLNILLVSSPGAVRPGTVKMICESFKAAAEIGVGLDDPQYLFEPLIGWKSEAAALVFTSFDLTVGDAVDKRFALEVADCLQYAEGQVLYKFATTVTKLID